MNRPELVKNFFIWIEDYEDRGEYYLTFGMDVLAVVADYIEQLEAEEKEDEND